MSPIIRPQRIRPSVRVVLALGSNLGDREETLLAAVRAIAAIDGVDLDAVSRFVETPAITLDGVDPSAPRYLNGVVIANCAIEADELLDALQTIETEAGRVRDVRWGDRTLDIDVIVFGGTVRDDERLVLPHPRAWQRAFVLAPWLQLDPFAVLPGYGSVAELRAAATDTVWEYPGRAQEAP